MIDTQEHAARGLDISRRWAHVTGTTGRFIQFNFTVADPDLTVELVMPYAAFNEFCITNEASRTVDPNAKTAFERLKWLFEDADGSIEDMNGQAFQKREVLK